jgi:hypothetical protein
MNKITMNISKTAASESILLAIKKKLEVQGNFRVYESNTLLPIY